MSTITKTSHFHSMIAGAMFGVLAASFAAVCPAADADVYQSTVKYQDLSATGSAGATALYSRIRAAAATVCQPLEGRDLASKRLVSKCVYQAIAAAVTKVNQPALSAVYNAKNGTSLPVLLASRQIH
jgi:UrcA family protein